MIFVFQNPESARNSFGPVAPARATRGMSSSTNLSAPREVFAEPLEWTRFRGQFDLAWV
jgi:hypothetical protein